MPRPLKLKPWGCPQFNSESGGLQYCSECAIIILMITSTELIERVGPVDSPWNNSSDYPTPLWANFWQDYGTLDKSERKKVDIHMNVRLKNSMKQIRELQSRSKHAIM